MTLRPADKAWIALGVGVAAWDVVCPRGEMLSQASARYTRTRPLVWPLVVIYVAGHLVHVWPVKYDPLSAMASALGH